MGYPYARFVLLNEERQRVGGRAGPPRQGWPIGLRSKAEAILPSVVRALEKVLHAAVGLTAR